MVARRSLKTLRRNRRILSLNCEFSHSLVQNSIVLIFKSIDRPPEMTVILLPLYDLMNSNQAFTSLLLSDLAATSNLNSTPVTHRRTPLVPLLISFTSYIFCHASTSSRARLYSRLLAIILTICIETGPSLALEELNIEIRLCRQVGSLPKW